MKSQALRSLGWKPYFEQQVDSTIQAEGETLLVARVAAHFGSQILCLTASDESTSDELTLSIQLTESCGMLAVGDWLLLAPNTKRAVRRLERQSLIARKAAGAKVQSQLIAANIDTLFIVTSCNHDFNLSRLERYLALATEAEVTPVIVLTKLDLCDHVDSLRQPALKLMNGLMVETVDARDPAQMERLEIWCGIGQTVALVGSSGVGKSTLATSLGAGALATQGIREDDSKGRHTTTARSIHRLHAGGLLIDTPGMRELQLADCEDGVAGVFDEIVERSKACRFRDCNHQGEPGCAVQAALEQGELDERRLKSYRKLQSEQARNSQSLSDRREQERKLGQYYKSVQSFKRKSKGH